MRIQVIEEFVVVRRIADETNIQAVRRVTLFEDDLDDESDVPSPAPVPRPPSRHLFCLPSAVQV